jgi:hypothetical protein
MTTESERALTETAAGFCSQDEFAQRHGLSRGAVLGAIQRGEVDVARVGARVLVCAAAFDLKALGLDDPAKLGAFCRALGIRNTTELLAFVGGTSKGVPGAGKASI